MERIDVLVGVIFLALMFLVSNYLFFQLLDSFLENPRLKKIYRIPVGLLNTVLSFGLTMFSGSTSLTAYSVIAVILFLELRLFYRERAISCLFCVLTFMVHVMAIRALCAAQFAIVLDRTLYDVANQPLTLVLSTGTCFLLVNVVLMGVIRLVSTKSLQIVNQHGDLLWFITAWLGVFSGYLLVNSLTFSSPNSHPSLLTNQITAPVAILIGTYVVLFFSVKTAELLGYKEKNETLQHAVEKERQYRNTIDKDVFRIIEANFSQNRLITGFEDYQEKLGDMTHDYAKMLTFMIEATVHPQDKGEFVRYSSSQTIVEAYERGQREIAFDYRRLMPDGTYAWMRVLMPLMQDKDTDDIVGYVQIKNIDQEKKRQLELQYKAERDLLTGLYNKSTTEMLIVEYFSSNKNGAFSGALFVIDIDNFKTINDRLGHLYGDVVLSELSENLRAIFRDEDVVGRIGGDEFLVFAKGLTSGEIIEKKAQEICKAFLRTYANEQKEDYTVSSSVGISVFPKDGTSYETLFKAADAALYITKAKGKNGYSFYERGFEMPYASNRTEIDTHGMLQKSFRDNRIEYVFRLLYGSEDTAGAIESVLELIAKNFGFSRANIFEFNEVSTHFNGVFEWCASGIVSVNENYVDMPLKSFEFVIAALERSGGMFLAVPADFPEYAQEHYTSIGIKSIVHFSIKERDKLLGVIAFQNCTDQNVKITDTELEELRIICQVLSVFMAKRLSAIRVQRHHQAIETIMDNMNSIAYVVDRETFEVFYENQNVADITGHASIGTKCYRSYRGFDRPCEDCAINHLSPENPRCILELYTKKFDLYTKTAGSLINWSNDREALLISSVDITEYKRQDRAKKQLETAQ